MSQVITNAFEQYWQSSLAAEQPVVLDEFILADIPNLDITSPIDPDTGLPPQSQIVHRQNVDQRGRINNNAVAYTIVMDTTVGDFSFNAMYLRNKQNGVIGMIVYKGRETKLKTDQTTGQTGNSLVKSMLMGYDQAAEATLTHVDAGTWQIDYAARLRGMDEDLRQLASQLYGHHTFIGDAFKVVEKDGACQVTQGVAIVGGLRVELNAPEVIHQGTKPIGVWVDVHRAGSLLSEHQNHFTIITSVADLADHVDGNGYQHYVAKLATVQADSTIEDGRGSAGGGSGGAGSIPDTFALWKRSMAEAGYELVGEFGTKQTITSAKQVMLVRDTSQVFSWEGSLPHQVGSEDSPLANGWVSRVDELLRNDFNEFKADIAAPSGSRQMGFTQSGGESTLRNAEEKMRERVTPQDYGAVGNGKVNDQVSFNKIEDLVGRVQVDMLGKTYLVDVAPTRKEYFNGLFLIAGTSATVTPNRNFQGFTRGKNTVVGMGAGENLPDNSPVSNGTLNTAIGEEAMKKAVDVRSSTAIGHRAMYNAIKGKYNIAVGLESLFSVNDDGTGDKNFGASRNVAVGDNSGRFITTGYQNVIMGRNAGQAVTIGNNNAMLGTNAMAGKGSLKFWNATDIYNMTPVESSNMVAVGSDALYYGGSHGSVAVGSGALANAKRNAINCNAIGADALRGLGYTTGHNGNQQTVDGRTGTYVMTPTDVTFTIPEHGLSDGWFVVVSLTSGVPYMDYQYYKITVIDTNTFQVNEPVGITTSGKFTLISYENLTPQETCQRNTAFGAGAMYGVYTGSENVSMGTNSMPINTGGACNVSIGDLTCSNLVGSSQNTALGYGSLRYKVDGSTLTAARNCTGIGYGTRVTGDNQAQIGNSAVTTYVYGTVQNRSDSRDKTELVPTKLGDDFIDGLEAEEGLWDMRDDYFEYYEVQVGIDLETAKPIFENRIRMLPKDGSKKRKRKHQWFVAQKVKALCDELGIDFGGLQDHTVNGGCDVMSLGYDEFIPPLTAYVQRRKKEIRALEGTVSSQQVAMETLSEQVKAMSKRLADAGL